MQHNNPSPNNPQNPPRTGEHPPRESELPVVKTIRQRKDAYCKKINTDLGELLKNEENRKGLKIVYHHKRCRFVRTEKNYRMLRNLELGSGVELMRATDRISDNIAAYVKENTDLVAALTSVMNAAKDAKAKFNDLRQSASNLEACTRDRCNRSQMTLLTGERFEDCDDKRPPEPGRRPHDCENASEILEILIRRPAHLCKDADTVLASSADILGLQTFSNIGSLSQTFLPAIKSSAKAFDDFVNDRIKASGTDLMTAQGGLTDALKALTDAEYALFNARIDVDTLNGVKDFLCHHRCECIREGEGKLENCKCEICEICQKVTAIYHRETRVEQPATNTTP